MGRLSWGLRWRLSVLWLLEWGITGAILTYLPLYFEQNGLSARQQGQLMAVSAIGLWVAPFVVSQICDRWMSSEKYLALAHLVGGLTLVAIPIATEVYTKTGEHFSALVVLLGLYAVAYFPTVPLASALTFRHLPDPDGQFSKVRIWGTVGWVLAGFSLSVWLGRSAAYETLVATVPEWKGTLNQIRYAFAWISPPSSSDCFRISAILSFTLSSFCVFLPPTPPMRTKRAGIAPLEALRMFGNLRFALLIAISFVLSMLIPLYTLEVPKLLEKLGFQQDWVPALMTIGQISEFPALLLLPLFLKKFGLKATFAIGMGAWLVRFAMFAFEQPGWLMLTAIGLHGVCHVFLIIVIQLYVDSQSRRDLRTSGQNLFAFMTMGVGMPLGFILGGELADWCRDPVTQKTNYHILFSIAAAITFLLLLIYTRWFRAGDEISSDYRHPGTVEQANDLHRTESRHSVPPK